MDAEAAHDDAPVVDQRARLAAAVRTLGHTSLRRELDDDELSRLADRVEAMAAEVAVRPVRERDLVWLKQQFFPADLVDGQPVRHFEDCFVSGPHNPLGIGLEAVVDGDEVCAQVVLRAGHEGAPERAHGGIVAAVFDDVLGYLMSTHAIPAFTGELAVTYLRPTPIGRRLDFRSRIVERRGRKVSTAATAHDGDELVATATGLFVEVAPERFRPS
jgi:acyl-coenzyme A thioesterase PaaI-like protein